MVNFGLRSWVLGIRDYFSIYDNLHLSAINKIKGDERKTLESFFIIWRLDE